MSDKELYSFSKLSTFDDCPRNYYYTYVEKIRGGDGIYSFLGTVCHLLCEKMYKNEINNTQAVESFLDSVEEADVLGLEWMSENVKNKYVGCIVHFFENFKPLRNDTITIEEYFEVEVEGITVRGYIDLYYILDDILYIVDFKTSSKFDKKTLGHKRRQLYIYAYALEKKYKNEIKLAFNMLKYYLNERGTVKERTDFGIMDEHRDAMVWVEWNKEAETDMKNFVKHVIEGIEDRLILGDVNEWEMCHPAAKSFFCNNLCSHQKRCFDNIDFNNN